MAGSILATTGLGVAACGSSSGGVGGTTSGTITIWDRSGDLFQVFDATIPSFNKKYPNIKVKHVAVDVDTKLPSTLITGVNVPDGVFYEDNNLPMIEKHYYDITDWIQPYVKDIVPFKVNVNTFDGRIKGIPLDLDPGLLYYRADVLEQESINPDSIVTYDDLLTVSQTLQNKLGPKVKRIHLEQDPGNVQFWVNMFANQQGVSMVDSQGKLDINSPPYMTIMQWIKQVHDRGLGTRTVLFSPDHIAAQDTGRNSLFLTPSGPYTDWTCC